VVNWNRRELLRSCLQSLASQTHPSFEVIVIDNGSDDQSSDLVKTLEPNYPVSLRLISNSTNRGFCAANNQGFAASSAEFVALLNNDAEADPAWLQSLESVIRSGDDPVTSVSSSIPTQNRERQRPVPDLSFSVAGNNTANKVGMAASKILVWEDPSRIDKAGHLMYPDGQNRGRGTGQLDRGQFDRVEDTLWPDGCAAMYRRAMLDEIGGFDEEFFAYADDAELGLRGRIAGWTCLFAPEAVVRHHRGATLGLGSARRLTLIERNRVLLAVKLFPWNLLWLNGAYYVTRLGAGLWAALRNRGELRHYSGTLGKFSAATALITGTVSALPLIPSMLRKRWAFRPHHRLTSWQIRRLLLRHRITLREISEQAT
jgi:GT2 family glycosyltransferase